MMIPMFPASRIHLASISASGLGVSGLPSMLAAMFFAAVWAITSLM